MRPIPGATVEKTWQKLNELSVYEAPRLLERFQQRQPLIFAYLMAAGDELLNDDEQELLLFLGVVIWEVISSGTDAIPVIGEKQLIAKESANFAMMEDLWSVPDRALERTYDFLEAYRQGEFLGKIFEFLMEDQASDGEIRDENKGNMLIYLKTVIDCFDEANPGE